MNQQGMLKPALIGGFLLGILSVIPFFNCLCCVWIIGGGVLAASLYVKSAPVVVPLGSGLTLGLLTGVIGAIVSTLFGIPIQFLMNRLFADYADQLRQMILDLPNLPSSLREILSSSSNAGLSTISIIGIGIFNLIVYPLIAMLGGLLGVAIFEKRKIEPPPPFPPVPPQYPPAPPTPPSPPPQDTPEEHQ